MAIELQAPLPMFNGSLSKLHRGQNMKREVTHLFLSVSVVAFTFCATAAMAQMTASPEGGTQTSTITQVATRFENNLLSLAQAMPADKFDFAPSKDLFKPGSPAEFATVRTFAQQLAHVCGEPYRLFAPFGVKPDADVDPKSFDSLKSKDELIKALKQSFDYQNKVIASMTPDNSFTPAGPRDMTRVSALVAILSDDGDHYGQLVEYLRMNGIVPPATVNQMQRMEQSAPAK
jgi:DinB family protein